MADPADTSAEGDAEAQAALEAGRLLFAAPCRFVAAAASLESLPPTSLPEIAFAGRSNVGKSSLINAVTGQTKLARTSNTPGRTQQLNFFSLDQRLLLVDLPGYGYAKAAKTKIRVWTRLIRDYLRGRPTLRRVCILIDARHGVKDSDEQIMAMLDEAAVSFQVVLTKCDKLSRDDFAARLDQTRSQVARHVAAHPEVMATSAQSGAGIPELRAALATLAVPRSDSRETTP
ncbi:MAG: YihA family ribosome biogenesis GTP-binding protein [Rhodospirillaceae bacterium]|nr:YihA family ribosome biogenesis GTP-binding protein [Rhodospirillaceae bacterium]